MATVSTSSRTEAGRRNHLISLNARLRACRRCHLRAYLDEKESVPIARDPEPDAPLPRILLVGQAPGPARRSRIDRSQASPAISSEPGSNAEESPGRSSIGESISRP